MSSSSWRCHNDAPVAVTILDCTVVQKKEDDPSSIIRFYNCEVSWGERKWRISRRYNMFHKLHEDLKSEFSSAHCLPPLPPKSMPMETIARFVLSDEDEVDLSEEQFLRARMRGLQAYLNRLLTIPCVSWSTRLLSFLEPDSGELAVFSEGLMTGIYGLQRNQFGLAVFLLKQQYTDDPFWAHVFPEPELRKIGLEHFFMAYVEASYYHGYAYVLGHSDQELAAIALWLPPGTDLTLMKMVKFGFAKVPVDCGVEACRRWQKLYSAWNDHRLSIMGETPHWYLWSLATNPESLGKGAADTLMNVVLEMSDTETEKFPVYIEVTNSKTNPDGNYAGLVGLFRDKYGFEVMEYHEGVQTIAYHLLRRDPGGKAAPRPAATPNPTDGAVSPEPEKEAGVPAATAESDAGQWV